MSTANDLPRLKAQPHVIVFKRRTVDIRYLAGKLQSCARLSAN